MGRSEVELRATPVPALGVVLADGRMLDQWQYVEECIWRTWILLSVLRRNHCGMGLEEGEEQGQTLRAQVMHHDENAPVLALSLSELLLDAESLLGRLWRADHIRKDIRRDHSKRAFAHHGGDDGGTCGFRRAKRKGFATLYRRITCVR
jgi:hypothetical protein